MGFNGQKSIEWLLYLLAAMAGIFALWLCRRPRARRALGQGTPWLLALAGLLVTVSVAGRERGWLGARGVVAPWDFVLAVLAVAGPVALVTRWLGDDRLLALGTTALLAGTAAWLPSLWIHLPEAGAFFLVPLVLSLTARVFGAGVPAGRERLYERGDIAVVAILIGWSFLTPPRLSSHYVHHLAFYLGSIELVKQGHWLLHDVPSQYGFLSILLPAAWPGTAQSALSAIHGLLLAGNAAGSYLVFRAEGGKGTWQQRLWFALAAFAGTFLLAGWVPAGDGPFGTPSSGAYRYGWVVWLALGLGSSPGPLKGWRRWVLPGIYAVAALWAVETFLYASVVLVGWLGARAWLEGGTFLDRARTIWREGGPFAVPIVLGVVAVEAVYRLGLGTAPDWYGYVEFALSYGGGRGAEAIDDFALVGTLAVAFFGVLLTAAGDFSLAPAAAAAAALLWASTSYYVARGHWNCAFNVLGAALPALVLVALKARNRFEGKARGRLAAVAVPGLGLLLAVALTSPGGILGPWWQKLVFPTDPVTEARRAFPASEAVEKIAGTAAPWIDLTKEAVPAVGMGGMPWRPWTNIYPNAEFVILKPERQRIYLRRYLARAGLPPEGILVRQRGSYEGLHELLREELLRDYQLVDKREAAPGLYVERYRLAGAVTSGKPENP